jgi:ubiquinone biosynthesis protein UbiJ
MNNYLALDPDSEAKITALDGKTLEVAIHELELSFFLRAAGGRIEVLSEYEQAAQSTMRAPLLALVKLGLSRDSGESALGGGIEMSGDMEAGRRFHELLKNVDIDWEEILATYTGDIVAHQIANAMRGLSRWGRTTADTIALDLTEYLQQESRQLPSAPEINQFLESVDQLQMAVDRMQARIHQLQAQRDEDPSTASGQSNP